MMAAGIPEGFYDSPDDLAAFIGNDISQAEMTQRVSMAAAAVQSIDPNLKTQLQDLYGIGVENDGELTAYFLDPERGVNVIEQRLQLEAAGLSSAAMGTLGGGFERQTAERLADLGVQRREITERLQGQAAVTQQLLGEEEAVTTSELAAAEFGLDSEATAEVARLRAQRQQRGRRQMGTLVTGAVRPVLVVPLDAFCKTHLTSWMDRPPYGASCSIHSPSAFHRCRRVSKVSDI